MQNISDNEEYYYEPTASDWADYMRWRDEYDKQKTDIELQAMCHYFEKQKLSILPEYYKPVDKNIELPKLTRIK